MNEDPKGNPIQGVIDNSICLKLSFSRLGTKRSVKKSQVAEKAQGEKTDGTDVPVAVYADTSMVHVGKDILDSPELRAILSHHISIRTWVVARSVPSPLFKVGVFVLPVTLLDEVYAYLEQELAVDMKLRDAFYAEYERLKGEAQTRLKELYNPADYPPVERLAAAFSITWSLIEWSTPGKLKKLNKALYDKEKAKAEAEWANATLTIRDALRVSMADLVDHFMERLSGDEDGKPKRLHEKRVKDLNEFMELFKARNLTGDADLAGLVEKAQKIMSGVDVTSLRGDADIRQRVTEGFTEIKAALDTMVEDLPSRKFALGDDEV